MLRTKAPIGAYLAAIALVLLGLGGPVPGAVSYASAATSRPESLVVLHTNDLHSHLVPFHRSDTLLVGGAAARAERIRRERERTPDLLLLDAGDVIQGTPAYNLYRGVPDTKALSMMHYDAVALGNHDLDDGPRAWSRLLRYASYPVVSANVFAAAESSFGSHSIVEVSPEIRKGATWVGGVKVGHDEALRFLAEPYVIHPWRGRKIAILGLTTGRLVDIVRISSNRGVAVADPVKVARYFVPLLRKKADVVIALTHIGVDEDRRLAEVPGIDLIVGGHSHTRLDQPVYARGANLGWGTPIVQTGAWGDRIGRSVLALSKGRPVGFSYALLPVSPSDGEDAAVAALIQPVADTIRTVMGETIYNSDKFYRQPSREEVETPIGNFAADVLREAAGADVAFQNSGGIRAPIPKGPVTVADVYSTFPFDNTIVVVEMKGEDLRRVLDFASHRVGKSDFIQVSGIKFDIASDYAYDIRVGGQPLDNERMYRVATIDFLYEGGSGYSIFREAGPAEPTGIFQHDAAVAFLRRHPGYKFKTEGRITWEGTTRLR